jgi:NAD-dependent histone deacetylase SIR2
MRQAQGKYFAMLAKLSIQATPTAFHELLQVLENCGMLTRVYTQNIDGLEAKVGFDIFAREMGGKCVLLHGCVAVLRCEKCGAIVMMENYLPYFERGETIDCPECLQKQEQDNAAAKRIKAPGSLRPNILLYNQPSPDGEEIWHIASTEANTVKNNHVLLICGTSLQIPGVKSIIKAFKTAMLDGSRRGCRIIYLDMAQNPPPILQDISWHVQMDCQQFATAAISKVKDHKQVHNRAQLEIRRDFRPIWDWN